MERILVFQHVKHENPGRFLEFFKNEEVEFDILELWKEYEIPDFKKYSRLLIMGGPQSVYDSLDKYYSKDFELESIRNLTNMGKSVLGLCLGSQLIANAFGGKVYQNKANKKPFKETGYFKVKLTKEGESHKLFKGFPDSFEVFQWHGDVFDLPKGAGLLATCENVSNQAFAYKNTYGTLFHLEFTPKMVEELAKLDNKWLHENNDIDEEYLIEQAYKNEKNISKLAEKLFKNWLNL